MSKKDMEIVLAFGEVDKRDGKYHIGGTSLDRVNEEIKRFEGNNVLLKIIIAPDNWRERFK
jgi:hypothetical protein